MQYVRVNDRKEEEMSEYKVKSLHMGPARCAVDLGDGSERGEYVDQDYILQKLDAYICDQSDVLLLSER